ncbi:GDP-L-fucose synthase [Pseudomonas sp. ENNP23]|uniref:GDP-L-fucose synthase family protein n=1 Tax=Pseudomonas sp. ENNP23 TaxID=1535636 RepID=UPI0009F4FAC5|nr:GDP-L-fucose synthase [Pseudomonas sp. ENNP23]
MKILLTGASGMLGRNILEHADASVHEWFTPTHAQLDLSNYASVASYLLSNTPDCVIHAAGKVGGIQANIREPVEFLIANLDMGRNVMMASAAAGVRNLLNIGSSCMYPRDRESALSEDDLLGGPLEPTNEAYALAKITVAKLAEYLSRVNPGFNYKTIIPCNLYGPHDKFDPRWSHLIPSIIHKLHVAKQRGDDTVDIWGDGSARREFLYVKDAASAILKAVGSTAELPAFSNIGLGFDYTVNEYYQAAAKVIGYQGGFIHDTSKPVGMKRKLSDVRRAQAWGWSFETSLETGLAETYKFYLSTIEESH